MWLKVIFQRESKQYRLVELFIQKRKWILEYLRPVYWGLKLGHKRKNNKFYRWYINQIIRKIMLGVSKFKYLGDFLKIRGLKLFFALIQLHLNYGICSWEEIHAIHEN